MRISGIGYANEKGEIFMHKNVIEGLSIYSGSILFGILYPNSKEEELSKPYKNDFMLTPIPYEIWPRTGRIIIRLKKQSQGFSQISEEICLAGFTVLHSTSNRSAHRYSTWDIHIASENYHNDELTWDESVSYFLEIEDELKKLKKRIEDKFSSFLFSEDNDIDLSVSIKTRVNTALQYFYNITEQRKLETENSNDELLFKPFSFRYSDGTLIPNTGGKLNDILMGTKEIGNQLTLPTVLFAEADSHYLNFRFRLVEQNRLNRLVKLSIYYERHSSNYTSIGLTSFVANNFPEDFKIWKYWNQLYECRKSYGSGKLSFFLEDMNDVDYSLDVISSRLKSHFDNLNDSKSKPKELEKIFFKAKVEPVFPELVKSYFNKSIQKLNKPKYDVFISYSSKDYKAAQKVGKIFEKHGCSYFIAQDKMKTGDIFSDKIREALINSREFCLIYSPSSRQSAWVTSEWGSAWTLKKKITPVLLKLTEDDILDKHQRLKEFQYIEFFEDDINQYAKEVFRRRFEYLFENDRYYYYG